MSNDDPRQFHAILIEAAHEAGFPLAGALDIAPTLPALKTHLDRYDHWLEMGHGGEMEYLKRGRDRRADPRLIFPEAKSILCMAIPYKRLPLGASNTDTGPRYARYLKGQDYHEALAERLEAMMKKVAERCRETSLPIPRWKICVDTSAVLERSWAALAGLGWIGKNTLLIHPKLGSYLFLAEVLLDQKTAQSPGQQGHGNHPITDLCGHCNRCLKACPTQALNPPHTLDSNRCISYWTLEKRGTLSLNKEDRERIGTWIAGCDLCQEACPFNLKPSREEAAKLQADLECGLPGPDSWLDDWIRLLNESEEDYRQRTRHSALKRVKPAQFRRNLAIALTNALPTMNGETRAALQPLIAGKARSEVDDTARHEWEICLSHF